MTLQVGVGPANGAPAEQGVVEHEGLAIPGPRTSLDKHAAEREGADPGGVL